MGSEMCIRDRIETLNVAVLDKNSEYESRFSKVSSDFEAVIADMTSLDETIHLHQLKLEVFGDEFHTYSQVVDSLEKKICDLQPV